MRSGPTVDRSTVGPPSNSFGNHIEGNIAYNGPRAGVNFDDGLGGGSTVTRNV